MRSVHAVTGVRKKPYRVQRVHAEKRALLRRRKMLKDEAYRRDYVGFITKILLLVHMIIVHLFGLVSSPGVTNHALIRSVCTSSMACVCMVWECKIPPFLKILAHCLQEHDSRQHSKELHTLQVEATLHTRPIAAVWGYLQDKKLLISNETLMLKIVIVPCQVLKVLDTQHTLGYKLAVS